MLALMLLLHSWDMIEIFFFPQLNCAEMVD
jgi:hypothetical protein